jgi:hypothetical protein
MSTRKVPWLGGVLGLLVVVGLPLLGWWARRHRDPGCALDGVRVDPAYRVEIVDGDGRRHEFCCPRCAEIWLDRQAAPPRAVTVTDEPTKQPLDAAAAHYVRSPVVTVPTTQNRIHVFRTRSDAEGHVAAFGGTVLDGADRPFPRITP